LFGNGEFLGIHHRTAVASAESHVPAAKRAGHRQYMWYWATRH